MNFLEFWTWSFWNWWVLGLVIIVLEVFLPGVLFLWFGISAIIVGSIVLLLPDLTWQIQILIFAVLGILITISARLFLKKKPISTDDPLLNRRAQQYIGRIALLDGPIVNGRGRIKLDDTHWTVEGPDMEGSKSVKIIGCNGIVLQVEPLKDAG